MEEKGRERNSNEERDGERREREVARKREKVRIICGKGSGREQARERE